MANAVHSLGTVIAVGDTSSPIGYTDIGNITSFSGLDGSTSEIEVSTLDSTAVERIAGLPDFGSVTLEIDYDHDDAGFQILEALQLSGEIRSFRITAPNTTDTIIFNAFVTGISIAGAVNEKITQTVSLSITGVATYS